MLDTELYEDRLARSITIIIISALIVMLIILGFYSFSSSSASDTQANTYGRLVEIVGYDDLYYDTDTKIVYIIFQESREKISFHAPRADYGYMSPHYSENGKLCKYDVDSGTLVEIN